ncbi:MAG: hypothetical protein KAU23_00850 [Anaerolineales bacterium]|nr:hypothetical protein [Anaerolineales bacterium]
MYRNGIDENEGIQTLKLILKSKVRLGLFLILLFSVFLASLIRKISPGNTPDWVNLLSTLGMSGFWFFIGINLLRFLPKEKKRRRLFIFISICLIILGFVPITVHIGFLCFGV